METTQVQFLQRPSLKENTPAVQVVTNNICKSNILGPGGEKLYLIRTLLKHVDNRLTVTVRFHKGIVVLISFLTYCSQGMKYIKRDGISKSQRHPKHKSLIV